MRNLLLVLFFVGLTANVHAGQELNIIDLARRLGVYSYLLALEETNNTNLVANTGNITVFMPTNEAFLKLPQSTRDYWGRNPAYYGNLIKYHVVQGKHMFKDLEDEISYPTFATPNLTGRFVSFTGYSKDVQVFMGAVINKSKVNIEASNGVIHFLDDVIGHFQIANLLETAKNESDLSKVLAAAATCGFDLVLKGDVPYTFFAPTNEAIGKLSPGAWDKLMHNTTLLKEMLNLHIASEGTWFSAGLTDKLVLETLNKRQNLTLTVDNRGVWIDDNKAHVIAVDIAATNGVIHKIDTFLTLDGIDWLN